MNRFVLLLAVLVAPLPAAAAPPCVIPGEPIQWIADYCMLALETDDEIATSGCIEQHLQEQPANACTSKAHYKMRICELLIRNGTRAGTLAQCVKDPAFKGRTVEGGGVGG